MLLIALDNVFGLSCGYLLFMEIFFKTLLVWMGFFLKTKVKNYTCVCVNYSLEHFLHGTQTSENIEKLKKTCDKLVPSEQVRMT